MSADGERLVSDVEQCRSKRSDRIDDEADDHAGILSARTPWHARSVYSFLVACKQARMLILKTVMDEQYFVLDSGLLRQT
jgi:hypothetical protein